MLDVDRNRLQQLRQQKTELDRLEAIEASEKAARVARAQRETERRADYAAAQDAAQQAEASRISANRKLLPDLTAEQFKGLPLGMRGKYYEAFGSNHLNDLIAREKAGNISRDDWEKLQNAEVLTVEVPGSQLPSGSRYVTRGDGAKYLVGPDGNERLIRSAPKTTEVDHVGMYFGLDGEWHRIRGQRG